MTKKTVIILVFSLVVGHVRTIAQNKAHAYVSGYVIDDETREPLPFGNILVLNDSTGTVTNRFGYFSLALGSESRIALRFSYVGYETKDTVVEIPGENTAPLVFNLRSKAVTLTEVEVTGLSPSAAPWYPSTQFLVQKQLAQFPSPGEKDLLRSLQRLPGITFNSELSSGLYIRGGTPDQTLLLMDGITVYNPSHLFGFFSMFSHDVLKAVKVIKGGFPAEYGTRSGSVVDILSIDGNKEKTEGKASIGLINAGLLLDGPVGDGSWMIAGRRSFFELFRSLAGSEAIPDYYFYDFQGKVTQQISKNDNVRASLLLNRDNIVHESRTGRGSIDESLRSKWSNSLLGLEWTRILSSSLFVRTLVSASHYVGTLSATPNVLLQKAYGTGSEPFIYENELEDLTAKIEVEHLTEGGNTLSAGLYVTNYSINYQTNARFNYQVARIDRSYSIGGIFAQYEMKMDALSLIPGFRWTKQSNERSLFFEPRLVGVYKLSPTLQIRGGGGYYYQWVNGGQPASFLTFSGIDFWFPVDRTIPASRSAQISADAIWNMTGSLTATLSSYYSKQRNIVELRQDAESLDNLRGIFAVGTGKNHGFELLLQGTMGDLSGMVGYTLSWATREFPDIDQGQQFHARHDKRHVVDIIGSLKLSETWDLSVAWTYSTGQAYTGILGYYEIGRFSEDITSWNSLHFLLSEKNALRLPNYHRLDIGATKTLVDQSWKLRLRIDIFNAYSRRNALGATTGFSDDPYYRLLPIVPTVTLEAEF